MINDIANQVASLSFDTLSEAGLLTVARFGDQPVTHHLAGDV